MTRSARRGPWLPEEDGALMSLVRSQGPNNWVRISQQLQHRSPKQCRERYHQNLKPTLKHDPISPHEGELIEQMVAEMGKRWAEIARRLGNRSDNAVKNWWNGSMNRRKRNPTQISTGFKQVGTRLQPIPFTSMESNGRSYSQPPPLPSHHSSTNSNHWSHEISYDSRLYQPSNLQIPSPVHTQHPSTANNSPIRRFQHQMYHSAPLPTTNTHPPSMESRSAYPRTGELDRRPELPPIRPATYPMIASESRHSASERPLISPALSDISQSTSLRHAPSLVSDNQSTYSVSPKTISSPRPGIPASIDANNPTWRENIGPLLPALRLPDQTSYQNNTQPSPTYRNPNIHPTLQKPHHMYTDLTTSKDTRMHVSSLLH